MDGQVLLDAIELIKGFLAGFQPDRYPGIDAAELVRRFTTIERLGAAGKTLAAGRVQRSGAWRTSGDRSPEAWLAAETGTTLTESAGVLSTAERVDGLDATGAAMREGRLSAQQTAAVASAAAVDPESEQTLLDTADRQSLQALRDEARAVRQAARGEAGLADRERIHRTRYLRHWTSDDGAFEGRFRLTPDHGAVILAALQTHRSSSCEDGSDAGEADALVAVARTASAGGGDSDVPPAVINVRVDYQALQRGYTEAGETCEIQGIGPVPVATVQAAADDAILRAILTDGHRVIDECTAGRTITTKMRRAVKERDRTCAVPGCDETQGLQTHHLHDVRLGGPTKLTNLARVCPHHHDQITYQHAQLTGGHPHWHWQPPPGKESIFDLPLTTDPPRDAAREGPPRPRPPPPPPPPPPAPAPPPSPRPAPRAGGSEHGTDGPATTWLRPLPRSPTTGRSRRRRHRSPRLTPPCRSW